MKPQSSLKAEDGDWGVRATELQGWLRDLDTERLFNAFFGFCSCERTINKDEQQPLGATAGKYEKEILSSIPRKRFRIPISPC